MTPPLSHTHESPPPPFTTIRTTLFITHVTPITCLLIVSIDINIKYSYYFVLYFNRLILLIVPPHNIDLHSLLSTYIYFSYTSQSFAHHSHHIHHLPQTYITRYKPTLLLILLLLTLPLRP